MNPRWPPGRLLAGRVCLASIDAGPAPTSHLRMAPVSESKKVDGRGAHLKKGAYTGAPRGRKVGDRNGGKAAKKLEDCWKHKPKKRLAAGGKKRGRKPGQKNAAK